jgi:hypothetical protein
MPARELMVIENRKQFHAAATGRERVRVRGVVAKCGDGYSGSYRNVWLRIETPWGFLRITATPSSPLGTMAVGSAVELAVRLTGMVDLAADMYYGERTQLLAWAPGQQASS